MAVTMNADQYFAASLQILRRIEEAVCRIEEAVSGREAESRPVSDTRQPELPAHTTPPAPAADRVWHGIRLPKGIQHDPIDDNDGLAVQFDRDGKRLRLRIPTSRFDGSVTKTFADAAILLELVSNARTRARFIDLHHATLASYTRHIEKNGPFNHLRERHSRKRA